MLSRYRHNSLGFTLVESLLALSLLIGAITLGAMLLKVYIRQAKIQKTQIVYKKIEAAIPAYFEAVIASMRKEGCFGYSDCPEASPLPETNEDADYTFKLHIPSSFEEKESILSIFDFCEINDSLEVICRDFKGEIIHAKSDPSPLHMLSQPLQIDPSYPYIITLIGKGFPEYEIDLKPLLLKKASDMSNVKVIADAMKSYHILRQVEEGTMKDQMCNPKTNQGGLDSSLDLFVPWIWTALNSSPEAARMKCSSSPCGCSNIEWQSSSPSLLDSSNIDLYKRFLENIGLVNFLPLDSLGNLIYVKILITDDAVYSQSIINLPRPDTNQAVLEAHNSGVYPLPISSVVFSKAFKEDEEGNYPISQYVAY